MMQNEEKHVSICNGYNMNKYFQMSELTPKKYLLSRM